jgi:hypothetical protein
LAASVRITEEYRITLSALAYRIVLQQDTFNISKSRNKHAI